MLTKWGDSLRKTILFSPRDWSLNPEDAWIYGIVIGWDWSLPEVAHRHGWSSDVTERLVHKEYRKAAYDGED